ncbi:MAG: sodium/proline symporter [Candidatus Azotimanducaceae bacterium]|jgi:sodium/proline symporter
MIGDKVGVPMTFLIYLVLMLVIGYIAFRRTTNLSD